MNHTKPITKLSKFEKQKTSFNLTFRYVDDVLSSIVGFNSTLFICKAPQNSLTG